MLKGTKRVDAKLPSALREETSTEMKFKNLLLIGVNHVAHKMYKNNLIHNHMKRHRFDLLLNFLQFLNNDIAENSDS